MAALIGSLRVSLGLDTAAFSDGMKAAQGKLAGIGTAMQKAGAALTAVGAGVSIALKSQIDSADEMSKAAAKFGVPIEQLSRLAYAGDLSDVSLDKMGTALGALSKNMAKFGEDSEGAVKAFGAVGVSATNADGSLRPTNDVLNDLADAFAGMGDGPEKTAAAMALFGKAGRDMIPLLNGGSAGLREMTAEADALGLTVTDEFGKAAENFNDNITRLQKSFGGLATQVAAQLTPVFAQISDVIVQVSERFRGLSPETQKFLSVGSLLAVAIGPVVAGLGLMAAAVAAIGLPVAAAIAGIAALTAGVVAFWPEIVKAKDAVVQFGTDALASIGQFVNAARAKLGEMDAYFAGLRDKFLAIGRDLVDGLLSGLRERWESVKAWFGSLAESIPGWIRDPLGIHSPSTVFSEIGRNIMQGLTIGLAEAAPRVQSQLTSVADGLPGVFQQVGQAAAGQFSGLVDSIVDGSADAGDALRGLEEDLKRLVLNKAFSGVLGSLFGQTGYFPIPGFAAGTRSAPGGLALVGERGPELVNLPRGSQVIPNHALGGVASGGDTRVEVNIHNAPAGTQVEEKTGPGGTRQIEIFIRDQVRSMMGQGALDGAMRDNFGVGRRPRSA